MPMVRVSSVPDAGPVQVTLTVNGARSWVKASDSDDDQQSGRKVAGVAG